MKRILLCAIVLLVSVTMSAQTLNYPIVQVDGKNYYSYTVEPKDGLYAISRKFGVSQADLHACNKGLESGLKIGQIILVPVVGPVAQENPTSGFITHEVLPKQTLYSLSRQYGMSIDELVANNPEVASGLKIGMQLKIPVKVPIATKQTAKAPAPPLPVISKPTAKIEKEEKKTTMKKTHVVQRKETLYSISRQYNVTVDDLVQANKITSIKVGQELIIPEPQKPDTTIEEASIVVVESPVLAINKADLDLIENHQPIASSTQDPNTLRIAVLLPFMLETPYIDASVNYFWDFYRGVLLGLNEVKKSGISVDLYTFDIEKNQPTLDSILRLPILKSMDLIIGPAYSNQVAAVSKFSRDNRIHMIVPFTSKIEARDSHEYVLQFNPSQDALLPMVAQTIADRFSSSNVIIARFTGKHDKANLLADEVMKALSAKRKTYREIQLGNGGVDTLRTLVGRNKTLLFLATTRLDVVSSLLPQIEALGLPALQIWGFEEWKQWTNFHEGTYYYSLFKKKDTSAYQANYKKWYGELSPINIPMYDLIGYDIINYTTAALKAKRKNTSSALGNVECELLQSDFKFQKGKYGTHWVNMSWSLFGYYNGKLMEIK
ncbi:MAG TPA: LysM peptidoglycan-binding domain-containing protein [Paludibacteraceae bacterium]|nr:LysM peptidoglycan-binding domain-containing protein [Paludibacteraceae bacterium]HQB69185.1 LysM peptidoglycan-binding domain-containing protein [Paludibacteraceae bacterium]HRS67734.1 LysM peptidoglycan-binding domain-containing protein [Paludibacteraceae bacterium]